MRRWIRRGEVTGKPLPQRLGRESEAITAEQLITWLRGVWTKDAIPIVQRLLDQADRGTMCLAADHRSLLEQNLALQAEVSMLRLQVNDYAMRTHTDGVTDDEAAAHDAAIRTEALAPIKALHLGALDGHSLSVMELGAALRAAQPTEGES